LLCGPSAISSSSDSNESCDYFLHSQETQQLGGVRRRKLDAVLLAFDEVAEAASRPGYPFSTRVINSFEAIIG
jgi:hypothetical protein